MHHKSDAYTKRRVNSIHEHLEQIMRNIKPGEEIITGARGRDRSGFEQEHGGHSVGEMKKGGCP